MTTKEPQSNVDDYERERPVEKSPFLYPTEPTTRSWNLQKLPKEA